MHTATALAPVLLFPFDILELGANSLPVLAPTAKAVKFFDLNILTFNSFEWNILAIFGL
jgi:hypothetical protein